MKAPAGKIYMSDGRVYEIKSDDWDIVVLRGQDGCVLEMRLAKDIKGKVEKIEWADNLGIESYRPFGGK